MGCYVFDPSLIRQNIAVLRQHVGASVIWGVVKGDGYGLGTVRMAEILRSCGIRHFAVAYAEEARALRENGFQHEPILMLRSTGNPDEVRRLLELEVILTIGSLSDLEAASACGIFGQAHLKIDTGLGRFGFLPERMADILACFADDSIRITGIYTHFSDAYAGRCTRQQFRVFRSVVDALTARGIDPGMVHCCNSAAFWYHPEMHMDAVRLGSALLGRVAFAEAAGLHRVGCGLAQVSEIRTLPKGAAVGYCGDCRVRRETKTAVLDVGYIHGFGVQRADGASTVSDCVRLLFHALLWLFHRPTVYAELNGARCRVLGHINMNTTVIDVTDCICSVGDTARLEISPIYSNHLPIVSEDHLQK